MAIGRISGPLLKANLTRNGVNLAFENNLLYLDVSDPDPANHKIGIKKTNPQYTLDVQGSVQASSILTPNFSTDMFAVGEVDSDLIPADRGYSLGTPTNPWVSLSVQNIFVDAFQINGNTISIIDSNADIELSPQGSGTVVVTGDTAFRIPAGPEITRPLGVKGQIRYNETNFQFEGYNGVGWISLGATRDVDGDTRITAELETLANDNTFRFYNAGVITGTWDINRLDLHRLTIDDNLALDGNIITTTQLNSNLVLTANGTGKIFVSSNNLDVAFNFNVSGVTTLNNSSVNGLLTVNGIASIQNAQITEDLTVTGNIFGDFIQTNDIKITDNFITTTFAPSELILKTLGGTVVRIDDDATITGDLLVNGDILIDGGDLTASTTTFNLINTNTTTVNFAGDAATVEIGSSAGTTSINNSLSIDNNLTIGNSIDKQILINSRAISVPNEIVLNKNDSINTFISYPLYIGHTTDLTPATGIGAGIRFQIETANNINKIGMSLETTATDITSATEDFDFVVRLMEDGNLAAEKFRISSTGSGFLPGNLAVNGGSITTNNPIANIFNQSASRINLGGNATRIEIGSATGITNINNNLDVDGDINLDGGDITTSAANFNIATTNATTVNAFTAATNLTLAGNIGTTTINNDLVVDGGVTVNNASELRFQEAAENGTNYVSLRSPSNVPSTYEIRLPPTNGNFGQVLATNGQGDLQWVAADTLVGNRFYVSAAFGDDKNNGFDAPVKTLKRAAELINEIIYTPKRTVIQEEKDTKLILNANKEYLKSEVTGFIDNNFAFVYNQATCARDTGLIVQSLAFDLLFNGNTQSTFAGLQYWAQDATSVPGQVEETVAAIVHAKEISKKIVRNVSVTPQVGNSSIQVFDLANPGSVDAESFIEERFNLIVSIINGNTNISNDILNNGNATTDSGLLNAFDLLQSNKLFIQNDTIAYVNNNFAFVYPQEICERDTGLIVQSLAFDILYQGDTQSNFAALRYWDRGASEVGSQSDETIASIEYAKTIAAQVVLNIAIDPLPGNEVLQVFDLTNPGSGAGSNIIVNNFDRVLAILSGNETDITATIVNNELRTTSNSLLNTFQLLLDNVEFIKAQTIAYINQNFNFTYNQDKCERDTGLIIDAASYDLAIDTNYNSVTAGLAYQRANAAYLASNQFTQTVAAINFAKGEAADSLSSNSTAQTRSNAAFDEVIDILTNGVSAADVLVYPSPTGVSAAVLAAKDQLRLNRSFIQAEIIAWINNEIENAEPGSTFEGFVYDSDKCLRDIGFIVDALSYDILYGGNSAVITNTLSYYVGAVEQLGEGQKEKTLAAYTTLSSLVGLIVQGIAITKSPGNNETQQFNAVNATATEASALADLMTIIKDYINDGETIPSTVFPDLSWVDSGIISARNQLVTDKPTIIADTIQFIETNYQSLVGDPNYSPEVCARDVGYILQSVAFDLVHGGNRQSTQAGVYYFQFDGTDSNIPTEIPQTVAAYQYLKTLVSAIVLNQDLSSYYQNNQERVPGLPASNTELSQILQDIDRIINVIQNGPSVISSREPISLIQSTNENNSRAFNLLRDNEDFIVAEVVAYVNDTFSTIAGYDEAKCFRDTGYILNSVSFDLKYGGNRQSIQSGIYYYSNTATISKIQGQTIQTIAAYNYLKTITQAVITNSAYTPLQNSVAYVATGNYGTGTEYLAVEADINRIINIIQNGPTAAEERQSISLTEVETETVVNSYEQLIANEEFIKAEVTQFINDTYTGLVYNKATCSRDIGYMIDAVIYDLIYGGNAKSIYSGEIYYNATTSASVVVNDQKPETVAAVEHLRTVAKDVLEDQDPTTIYSSAARVSVADLDVTTTTLERAAATTAIQASFRIISDTLANGVGHVRPINYGPGYFAATGSIFVASGDYVEDNPIVVPDNTAVIGSDLRSVIIRPKNSKKDIFRLRNGSYMYGFTWRDAINPVNKEPIFTFDFATTFDNPGDLTTTRGAYPQIPLTKPIITQSPYIQNVSIISFLGGSGALLDGDLVETPNTPPILLEVETQLNITAPDNFVPEQGKSMVANAYTMVSFGGIGWKLINDAYAQIVSCFQIFLLEGVVCKSGGYCSITNSATNFGLYSLRSSGYSRNAFSFDRGIVADTGIISGLQSLRVIGTERQPVEEFVTRFRTADSALDITSEFQLEREKFDFDPTVPNVTTNIFGIINHEISNKQRVIYSTNGGTAIGGLENDGVYYVSVLSPDEFILFVDEELRIPVDITSIGAGGTPDPENPGKFLHTFRFFVEEFFVVAIKDNHNDFAKLLLTPNIVYNFVPGTTITATTVIEGTTLPNSAYVYSFKQGGVDEQSELIVAVNTVVVDLIEVRVPFNTTSLITEDQSIPKNTSIPVQAVDAVTNLFSSEITVRSTIPNSAIQNIATLPGRVIWFHRPSIVNSSSHTWEYAGSGIDYNALPQNGGKTREEFEQFSELPGRVYSSGTNELGDFKIGNFIRAENKTGNITFRNEVTVGQLNALRLSLSDIEISKISNDPGLGDNEPGGASDSALITQLSIRTFIANRLGQVVDKQVSTNANAGALVQLNSSGQINRDLIPPLRTSNSVKAIGYNSRLELFDDQPAINVLTGDTVVEEFLITVLTLNGAVTIPRNTTITQTNSGATAIVVLDAVGSLTVQVTSITGTFTTNPADDLVLDDSTVIGAYIVNISAPVSTEIPYVLTIDTISQFLVLFNKTTGVDYSFTTGNLVSSTINPAVGEITDYTTGVATTLNTLTYAKGNNYTPATGSAVYLNVALTGGAGTGARADLTVTNGQIVNVDLRRGGTGYVVGNLLSVNNADVGGTGTAFSIAVTSTEQRLYVDLVDAVKFIGSTTVPDFISDDNAPVKSIANLTAAITKSFLAPDISSGGNVNYATSVITIESHGYANGDPVLYSSGVNSVIGGLINNNLYYIKVLTSNTIELYSDYALVTKISFTSSSTGTHTLSILFSNSLYNRFYISNHGFLTGAPLELVGGDIPVGLVLARYYVGSVTQNSFTLHQLRIDALASVSGLTTNAVSFGDQGTGSLTFTEQNVQIVGNINTSSKFASSYTVLSATNLDAANIVSGIIATSRLGTGLANSDTFLRGDNTFQVVIQSLRKTPASPVAIIGDFVTIGTGEDAFNRFYGNVALDVDRASELLGDLNYTNVGVASFFKGQFDIDNGKVAVKSGRIDALSLGGFQASYFLDPSNLTSPVPLNRGGTGLSSFAAGAMIYGSTPTAAAALPIGTANSVMVSNGSEPTWQTSLNLVGNLAVNGDTVIGDSSIDGLTINVALASVPNGLVLDKDTSATTGMDYPITVRRSTTGVPALGIGVGIGFVVETSGNNYETGGTFEIVTTDVTPASEDFDAIIKVITNGASPTQVLKVRNNLLELGAVNTATTITTQGTGSLTINTNSGTNSGSITIAAGINGNITLTPNGSLGKVILAKTTEVQGDLVVSGAFSAGGVALFSGTTNGLSNTANIDLFDKTVYRSGKYTIQIQCTAGPDSGKFQASEILLIHDGVDSYKTEYAVVKTGPNEIVTFTTDVSGNDVRLRAVGNNGNVVNIKFTKLAQLV